MDFSTEFEILRPYIDSEVKPAIDRIIEHPYLKNVFAFIYPDQDFNEVVEKFKKIRSVDEFQAFFSDYAVRQIVKKTSSGLTYSGFENLDTNTSYLFIANHHDIVLDSAMMQVLLLENGHRTSQITFGSNLMSDQMIIDLGKLNKMFTFYRGGTKMEKYKNALLHSAYMRHVITQNKESIWIAQRDGRTKDGDDKTQSGLIKMLFAGRKDYRNALMELNIVPVCTSYEYVPCDIQKARELCLSENGDYVKESNEDFMSVLNGITQFKGKIHMKFGKPINEMLSQLDENIGANELADLVVENLDRQIHQDFALNPCNYIALDLMHNESKYLNEEYSVEQKDEFIKYVDSRVKSFEIDLPSIRNKFLEIYANPVKNYQKY